MNTQDLDLKNLTELKTALEDKGFKVTLVEEDWGYPQLQVEGLFLDTLSSANVEFYTDENITDIVINNVRYLVENFEDGVVINCYI